MALRPFGGIVVVHLDLRLIKPILPLDLRDPPPPSEHLNLHPLFLLGELPHRGNGQIMTCHGFAEIAVAAMNRHVPEELENEYRLLLLLPAK